MGNLDTAQIEQLHAIGEYLQQIRLEQARSLEDIAAKTYIPLRILRALEAGQQDTLPEPVFVQGFIRRYGEALGLDGSTLAQSFPVARQIVIPEPRQDDVLDASDMTSQQEPSEPSWLADARRSPLLYAGAALLLIAALYSLSRLFTQPQRPEPATVSTQAPASSNTSVSPTPSANQPASPVPTSPTSSSPVASPAPAASPASSAAPKPSSASPVSVAVNLSDAAWLQVITDGTVTYEGTLPKGTKRTWTAKRELTIVSGNAGAVSTAFNGGTSKVMGTTGMVEELTFTPKGSDTTTDDAPTN